MTAADSTLPAAARSHLAYLRLDRRRRGAARRSSSTPRKTKLGHTAFLERLLGHRGRRRPKPAASPA